jgi:mono/diheme cytochrome c family protein
VSHRRRRLVALLLGLAGASACAAGLPHPSEVDVARARERWPETSRADLEKGREVYVVRCSTCHPLHRPTEYEPARWDAELHKMAPRARLSEAERDAHFRYVMAVRGD